MKKWFPRIPFGPSLTFTDNRICRRRPKIRRDIDRMAYLDRGDPQALDGLRVPEALAGGEKNSLLRCEVRDDSVYVGFGEV